MAAAWNIVETWTLVYVMRLGIDGSVASERGRRTGISLFDPNWMSGLNGLGSISDQKLTVREYF